MSAHDTYQMGSNISHISSFLCIFVVLLLNPLSPHSLCQAGPRGVPEGPLYTRPLRHGTGSPGSESYTGCPLDQKGRMQWKKQGGKKTTSKKRQFGVIWYLFIFLGFIRTRWKGPMAWEGCAVMRFPTGNCRSLELLPLPRGNHHHLS